MRLTNEVARTGWSPKVDSAGIKFQVYLSHSGVPKPKNGKNVHGGILNTVNAQGGMGEIQVVRGLKEYLKWRGILRSNGMHGSNMTANTKQYEQHLNETGFVFRSLRSPMHCHNNGIR